MTAAAAAAADVMRDESIFCSVRDGGRREWGGGRGRGRGGVYPHSVHCFAVATTTLSYFATLSCFNNVPTRS